MSSRSLTDLRPEFAARVTPWLAECVSVGLDILVYCTFRANDEQDKLYASGRTVEGPKVTNARAGQSAHNYALALDFVPMMGGKAQWKAGNPLYRQAVALAQKHGMESLCVSSFPEWPHIQIPNWKDYVK